MMKLAEKVINRVIISMSMCSNRLRKTESWEEKWTIYKNTSRLEMKNMLSEIKITQGENSSRLNAAEKFFLSECENKA